MKPNNKKNGSLNIGRIHAAYKLLLFEFEHKNVQSRKANSSYNFQHLQKNITLLELSSTDASLSNYLYKGICRYLGSIDQLISLYSQIPLEKIHEVALTALRIGIFSICKTRSPNHSSVHQAVELCSYFKEKRLTSFVNAILRTILRKNANINENISENIPKDLYQKILIDTNDVSKIDDWLAKLQDESPTCIVYKKATDDTIQKTPLFDDQSHTIFQVHEKNNPKNWQGYNDGLWWVQDRSAYMSIFQTLQKYIDIYGSIQNTSVLDMCAAPGGKSFLALEKGCKVFACDVSQSRIDTLYQNIERLQFDKKQIFTKVMDWLEDDLPIQDYHKYLNRCFIQNDIQLTNHTSDDITFDIVILDAPCSSSGLIRRHPEIRWLLSQQAIQKNAYIQQCMLQKAQHYVREGGILLYAVCSVFLEEGQKMVGNFLNSSDIVDSWTLLDYQISSPPIGDEDGFQSFVLQKK